MHKSFPTAKMANGYGKKTGLDGWRTTFLISLKINQMPYQSCTKSPWRLIRFSYPSSKKII